MRAAGQTASLKSTPSGSLRVNGINGRVADADTSNRTYNIFIRFGGLVPSYFYEPGSTFSGTFAHPLNFVLRSGDEVRWYDTTYE